MSSTSDATNLTSRVIAMIVAVVIVAVVMIPVINSLTDTDNGGDSTITITNTGIGFAKTDRDDAIHTMIISKDTNDKMKVTVDGQDVAVPTLPDDNTSIESDVTLGVGPNHTMIIAQGWGTVLVGDGFDNESVGDWTMEDVTITFQNGRAMVEYNDWPYTFEIDLYRSNTADYVYCTDHAKAPLDATVYVGHWDLLKYEGESSGCVCLYPESGLMNEVVVDTAGFLAMDNRPLPSMGVAEVSTTEHYYEVSEFSSEPFSYTFYDESSNYIEVEDAVYYPGVYVPATFSYEDENAGGSTDSDSDSGITGTILSIVPIFVLLGILVSMVIPIVTSGNRFN